MCQLLKSLIWKHRLTHRRRREQIQFVSEGYVCLSMAFIEYCEKLNHTYRHPFSQSSSQQLWFIFIYGMLYLYTWYFQTVVDLLIFHFHCQIKLEYKANLTLSLNLSILRVDGSLSQVFLEPRTDENGIVVCRRAWHRTHIVPTCPFLSRAERENG